MALAKLQLEGFKTLTNHTLNFYPHKNFIKGANGIGKSSVADAFAFLYCGTDRFGNQNPQHLINKEMDKLKLVGSTDSLVEISRTLTNKGSSTLKITKNGVSNVLNQQKLSEMLGTPNVFLSAIMPGYFMSLSTEKRKDVLKEILPDVDPYAIVLEKTGVNISGKYDLSKKKGLSEITQDRRTNEISLSRIEGQIESLLSTTLPPEPQIEPSNYQTVDEQESLSAQWSTYTTNRDKYNTAVARLEQAKIAQSQIELKRKDWKNELSMISFMPVPNVNDVTTEISRLISTKEIVPQKPQLQDEFTGAEKCPTCGTEVSRKMKETIRAANEKAMATWEQEVVRIKSHNTEIDAKVSDLQKQQQLEETERRKVEKENSVRQARVDFLQTSLDSVVSSDIPVEYSELPPLPSPPTVASNTAILVEAKRKIKEFDNAKAIYDHAKEQMKKADDKVTELKKEVVSLTTAIESLQKIEEVVKNLPNTILSIHQDAFKIEGIDLEFVEGEVRISWNGVPYTALSTGQRMRVDLKLSSKINSLMKKPVNIVFVDDADLMDEYPEYHGQIFLAHVVSGCNSLIVEEILEDDR